MKTFHSPLLANPPGNGRMDADYAVKLLESADLDLLCESAHEVRMAQNPGPVVTYIVDRNINYSNICDISCKFCAFSRKRGDPDAFELTREELGRKIKETLALGGRQILIQGGMNLETSLESVEEMFRWIKENFPIHIHGLSAPEVLMLSRVSGLSIEKVLVRLRAAGLDSLPGGGAEILVDEVRQRLSPKKGTADDWYHVHETWHGLGGRSTATMMFGHVETLRDRIEHLRRTRELQDMTGGFTAFIGWTFQPGNTCLQTEGVARTTTNEDYLRTMAVARIFLDNIKHIQSSWITQGAETARAAMRAGCDDMSSIMIEENVVRAAGAHNVMDEPSLRSLITQAGFEPKRRDFFYNILE